MPGSSNNPAQQFPQHPTCSTMLAQASALHAGLLDAYTRYLTRQVGLRRLSPRTRFHYFATARRFLKRFPIPVEQVTPEHIEGWLLERPLAPRTMQTELLCLRAFFKWLVDEHRLLQANPAARAHKPRWHRTPRPAPSEAQFLAVCRACRTLEEVALVEGLYWTGLRISEMRWARVRDIDVDQGMLTVEGKGGRRERAFFPAHVGDLLRAQGGDDLDGFLFASPRYAGRARELPWLQDTLRCRGQEAGLPYRLTAHLLRHGTAGYFKPRVPLPVLQKIMRHRSIQVTVDMYGGLDADDVKRAYDRALRESKENT